MRRTLLAFTLSAGCFGEPDTIDKTPTTTVAGTTVEPMESSSSGESSSSEGESSSSGEPVDPGECPEWCIQGCDDFLDFELCRCTADEYCQDGLRCDGYMPPDQLGHCR